MLFSHLNLIQKGLKKAFRIALFISNLSFWSVYLQIPVSIKLYSCVNRISPGIKCTGLPSSCKSLKSFQQKKGEKMKIANRDFHSFLSLIRAVTLILIFHLYLILHWKYLCYIWKQIQAHTFT